MSKNAYNIRVICAKLIQFTQQISTLRKSKEILDKRRDSKEYEESRLSAYTERRIPFPEASLENGNYPWDSESSASPIKKTGKGEFYGCKKASVKRSRRSDRKNQE
ncbi:hypothetical protein [Allobaculum sp. Allo2]|uniref:hypothetical protein n=1 Tax=Allobaculum sp. Allo2 TaxID=2853432 RepID=UPI001F609D97|nr:hypothetical protein [Allobaculum sp. Allo2]UNT94094.1 hypothetical protein KWG61_05475 [Allobaculum sp. Allo2]